MWALDRGNGQFLWATPFPYDTKNFIISNIDVKTGIAHLNTDLIFREPGQNHVLCYWNTRSYWPLAYHPGQNSLYVPYRRQLPGHDVGGARRRMVSPRCRKSASARDAPASRSRIFAGVAKVNMSTGEAEDHLQGSRARKRRDARDRRRPRLLGRPRRQAARLRRGRAARRCGKRRCRARSRTARSPTVNGKQYLAVLSGEGLLTERLMGQVGLKPTRGHNAVHVFALP